METERRRVCTIERERELRERERAREKGHRRRRSGAQRRASANKVLFLFASDRMNEQTR